MIPPPRHALIIEDEMIVGMSMQSILAELGFDSVAFASTAGQALEQARVRRPDLVTADISLLDGDGVEACRALEAEYGRLLIIYVTGQEAPAPEPGHAVVVKPFSPLDISFAYRALKDSAEAA